MGTGASQVAVSVQFISKDPGRIARKDMPMPVRRAAALASRILDNWIAGNHRRLLSSGSVERLVTAKVDKETSCITEREEVYADFSSRRRMSVWDVILSIDG